MKEALKVLLKGETLSRQEANRVMDLILKEEAQPEQIGAMLAALQFHEPNVDEIVGFVETLRANAIRVESDRDDLIDVCGTGGDGAGTFNVSTSVCFVVAGAGQAIAKHGNRSVSSRSGSFDVLEALHVPTVADPDHINESIERHKLGFLFAPSFHPAMKAVAGIRKNLGVRTVFNVMGPLLNPVGVKRQLIGVFSEKLLEPVAHALHHLGAKEAMIVRGEDGLDEITISGPTKVAHLKNGKVETYHVTPEDFGASSAPLSEVLGGDAKENADILLRILKGEKGPCRDLVLLNAAGALVIGGKAADLKEGFERAAAAIDSGEALRVLHDLQDEQNKINEKAS